MFQRLKDLSLRAKITTSFVLIVLCGTSISTLIGSRIITSAMLNEARKQVRQGLDAAGLVYAARLETVRKAVVSASENARLVAALDERSHSEISGVLAGLRNRGDLDFLVFVDSKRPESTGPFAQITATALEGRVISSTELIGGDTLAEENPSLTQRGGMVASSRNSGMVLLAVAPVNTPSIRGVMYGGILLNQNQGLVSEINQIVFGAAGPTAGTVSILLSERTIASNAPTENGETAAAPSDAADAVLRKGGDFYGRSYAGQSWYLTGYTPIRAHQGSLIGMLHVAIPEAPFLAVRTSMMLTFLVVAAVGVIVVLGLTYLITRSMIYPLEDIVEASNRIAAGDLDYNARVSSQDEIGRLANSFNKMVGSIKTMKMELQEWGRTLEEKVKARTEELVAVQSQMVQSEKLASLGRLAAGVAHEINNPLSGILTFSSLALEDCEEDHPMRQSLEIIVKQTLRCRETVKGLLDFARQSNTAVTYTDVNSVVDRTLALLEKQMIFHNIRILRTSEPDLPTVLIDPGQLQQVIVNIMINAADAMEENGTLTVETRHAPHPQQVLIIINDTGKGIPNDVLPFIFEPFFTTKKVGKGTGLGLSIVHGIVTRAGGNIRVTSSPHGATFTVCLPISQEEATQDAAQQ